MRRRLLGGLLAAGPLRAFAQGAPSTQDAAPVGGEMRVDLVRTGLYLIEGGGCNSLLRLSAAGCVLVDGKQPGTYRALMSRVRRLNRISDLPLRAVVFTNHREVHAGNRTQFVDAHVAVLAQSRALARLGWTADSPPDGGGDVTPAHPRGVFGFELSHGFRIGGVEIRLHHFGRAKTDDDIVVHFPDLRVVALGDLYDAAGPAPDVAGGGELLGWREALERILELDFDLAVPSDGPIVPRDAVVAFRTRLDALVAEASSHVQAGLAQERLRERLAARDPAWTMRLSDPDLQQLYEELQRTGRVSPARGGGT